MDERTMRLFIAIELPDEIKREITEVQQQFRASGANAAWTRPEGVHLTLKFLGEVPEQKVPEIRTALTEAVAGTGSFRLEIKGAGAFPNAKAPRVVWIGVAGEREKLATLQTAVEQALQGLGFEPEDRKFSPHLTVARVRFLRKKDDWQTWIGAMADRNLGGFEAGRVSLMKSELHPAGAVYTEIASVRLEKPAG
jgi:2'-5' RNA ligase